MTSTDKHTMIPFDVIVKAADGDPVAINEVVAHYSGFIGHCSLRTMKDEQGHTVSVVDETLRGRIQTRLITKILSFDIDYSA